MSNHPFPRLALLTLLMFGASGCSTIKSWFPDKERDYQFTTEIPELVIPDNLKAGGVATAVPRTDETVNAVVERPPVRDVEPVTPGRNEAAPENVASKSSAPVSTAGASSLQIDQSQMQAARLVARALSRQKLEIVERNIDRGYFYVKFDPNAVKAEDETILDELNFVFGDDPSQELEYRITLQELNPQSTEVTVQDSEGKTLSNAPANALLKLITDAINQDVPKDVSGNDAQNNAPAPPQ